MEPADVGGVPATSTAPFEVADAAAGAGDDRRLRD